MKLHWIYLYTEWKETLNTKLETLKGIFEILNMMTVEDWNLKETWRLEVVLASTSISKGDSAKERRWSWSSNKALISYLDVAEFVSLKYSHRSLPIPCSICQRGKIARYHGHFGTRHHDKIIYGINNLSSSPHSSILIFKLLNCTPSQLNSTAGMLYKI